MWASNQFMCNLREHGQSEEPAHIIKEKGSIHVTKNACSGNFRWNSWDKSVGVCVGIPYVGHVSTLCPPYIEKLFLDLSFFFSFIALGFRGVIVHPHLLVRAVSTSTGCNQWLLLAKTLLKVALVGRTRSLVARTCKCGWAISCRDGALGPLEDARYEISFFHHVN